MDKLIDYYWTSPEFKKYSDNGTPVENQFDMLMKMALSKEVYPVIGEKFINPLLAPEDCTFHIMDLDDYLTIKAIRLGHIAKEIRRREGELLKLEKVIPGVLAQYDAPTFPALDGLVRQSCELCGSSFISQENLVMHYLRKHGGISRPALSSGGEVH